MTPAPPLGLHLRESRHTHNANDAHNQTTSTTSENITHTSRHPLHPRRRAPLSSRTSRRRDMTPNHTQETERTQHLSHPTTTHAPLAALLLRRTTPLLRSRSTPVLTCTTWAGVGVNVILIMYILAQNSAASKRCKFSAIGPPAQWHSGNYGFDTPTKASLRGVMRGDVSCFLSLRCAAAASAYTREF